MSSRLLDRRVAVLSLLVGLVVVAGGLAVRKLAGPKRGSAAALPDEEVERRRVAAFDPTFDPARPGGALAGLVKDADGRPVDGAIVAVTRQRGKEELPTMSRPIPRTTVTDGGGRFQLADVLPGDYGVTATASAGSPGRLSKVKVTSGQTTEVTVTLGQGGFLLTGEVSDVGGGAIGGAKALVRSMGMFLRPGDEPAVFQVVADDNGVFKLRLAAGDYDVTVKAEGYAPVRDRPTISGDHSRRYRLHPAARLAGRVVDRQSREPVPGANVWLRLDRLESWVDRDATADDEGRFEFDDLAAGGYVVLARHQGSIGLAQAVSVGVAQAVTDVEVLVQTARSITGTVVGTDGKPRAGVRVIAGRSDPPYERPQFVKSGADGSFTVQGLLPAKYRVSAFAEGQGSSKPETAQVTSRDVVALKLVIDAALKIRGQVLDASGQPVPEATVTGTVESQDPTRRFALDRTTTDGAGRFELDRLSAGKLTLTARHPERGNAKLGPEPTETVLKNPALTLRLQSAAGVSGTVKYEDGTPAARVLVMAQPAEPGVMFGPPDQVTTDEEGRYRIGGLDPGKFSVMARRENSFNMTPGARQQITLAVGEQKTGVDMLLPPGGKRIAGKVLTEDGQPVSGAVVSLGHERAGMAFRMPIREGGPQTPHAVSDQDGAFALEDLQEGTYTLWASDALHADGQQKGVNTGNNSVVIKLQGGASVAGVVRTKQGAPVTDYTIAALPGGRPGATLDERMRTQMNARTWSPSSQVHDPAGSFVISRLAPGSYDLTVTTADSQAAVLPVTVAAGEKKQGLTLVIDLGSKLIGRVHDLESGAPLPGVSVHVMSATNRLEGQTGNDGSFTIEGLPPGRVRVDFRLGTFFDGTHIAEHTEVEPKPGMPVVDAGVIMMMKGSYKEKFGNDMASRGRIGFTPALHDGRPSVTGVRPGMPAEKAGLKEGDLLLKIGGKPTDGLGNGALDFLAAGKQGDPLVLTVQSRQGGAPRDVTVQRVAMDYDPQRPNAPAPPPPPTTGAAASR